MCGLCQYLTRSTRYSLAVEMDCGGRDEKGRESWREGKVGRNGGEGELGKAV